MQTAALFDLDGVLVDTETQYTAFWERTGRRDVPACPDFANRIKGHTLREIFSSYYDGREALQRQVEQELVQFEKEMHFPFIPGAMEFVQELRKTSIPVAVVTSSNLDKMACLYAAHPSFADSFDRIFTAEDALRSKPAPDCYLAAASAFGLEAEHCFVFEDSLNGLRAAQASGAVVVGLSTGLPADIVRPYCNHVMPDFRHFSVDQMLAMLPETKC